MRGTNVRLTTATCGRLLIATLERIATFAHIPIDDIMGSGINSVRSTACNHGHKLFTICAGCFVSS
jgi:hypothetical protein